MSDTICKFCQKVVGKYTCPRCGVKYCSSVCYKQKEHNLCSESFFREWINLSLQEKTFNDAEKLKMIDILKNYKEETFDFGEKTSLALADRLDGLNLKACDSEDILWHYLNEEERGEFMRVVDEKKLSNFIPILQPWWSEKIVERIVDLDALEKKIKKPVCPPHPINVKNICQLTSKEPSNSLKYNLINILFAYAYLQKIHNTDLRDLLEDVINSLIQFSPVLTGKQNYFSVQEALLDTIRLITISDLQVSVDFVKSISRDVCKLLEGPENAPNNYFVMCALNDLKLLFFELKPELSGKNTGLKKKIVPIIKKLEYLMSLVTSSFSHVLAELAHEITLVLLPDYII